MKNKNLIIAAIVVVALIGIYFLIKSGGFQSQKNSKGEDQALVEDTSAKDTDVYSALTRLGSKQDPAALKAALNRAKDPQRIVREGAANALGYFQDEAANKALVELLNDKEVNVRVRTMQALSHNWSQERELMLVNHLTRPDAGVREHIIAHSVLIKNSKDESLTKESISKLKTLAAQADDLESYIAFSKLIEVSPKSSLISLAKEKLRSSRNPEMLAQAIRYLSLQNDQELKSKLPQLQKHSDDRVSAAAKQASEQMRIK